MGHSIMRTNSIMKTKKCCCAAVRLARGLTTLLQKEGILSFKKTELLLCSCAAGQGLHDSIEAVSGGLAIFRAVSLGDGACPVTVQHHVSTLTLKLAQLQLARMGWAWVRSRASVFMIKYNHFRIL